MSRCVCVCVAPGGGLWFVISLGPPPPGQVDILWREGGFLMGGLWFRKEPPEAAKQLMLTLISMSRPEPKGSVGVFGRGVLGSSCRGN